MFVVLVGSVIATVTAVVDPNMFAWAIAVWLWFTLLFANFAESVAEGRGKAQAESLRKTKQNTMARRLTTPDHEEPVNGTELRVSDLVVVEAGELIPGDGDVVEGIATVDESAITGESGHTFVDRMIALVEGAVRQKTPNEIALNILLAL